MWLRAGHGQRRRYGAGWALAAWLLASTSASASTRSVRDIQVLLDEGRYQESEQLARAVLTDPRSSGIERQQARRLAIESRVRNGLGTDRETGELLKGLGPSPSDADPLNAGPTLRVRGMVLLESGAHRAAVRTLRLAVAALDRTPGSHRVERAGALEYLAQAQLWLERYDAALQAIDRAVAERERAPSGASPALARALAIRGVVRYRRGENGESRTDFERAVGLARAHWPDHPDTGVVLTLYVDRLWSDGAIDRARPVAERAVSIAESQLRPGHPAIAAALRRLAFVAFDLGDTKLAGAYRTRALAIAEAAYGRTHVEVAAQLNDLAISLTHGGEYMQARRVQQRGLAIYEATLPPLHSYITHGVHNLADVALQLHDYDEAARLSLRAIRDWSRTMGADHEYVAWALMGLAEARMGQRRYRAAVPVLERALRIRERALGPRHLRVARVLNRLALCALRADDIGRAEALASRAVDVLEEANAPDGLAEAMAVRGHLAEARGDHAAAQAAYSMAISAGTRGLGEHHPTISTYRVRMAAVLAKGGQTSQAFEQALEADRIGRSHQRLAIGFLPEREALRVAAARPGGVDLALTLPDASTRAAALLDAVIRGRSLVLDEIAARQRRRTAADAEALAPLLADLTAASRTLANLTVRGPDPENPGRYRQHLANARADKERIEGALAERSASLRRELQPVEAGLPQVQGALAPDQALVSILRHDQPRLTASGATTRLSDDVDSRAVYVAFVLRAGSGAPALVPLGDAASIDTLIDRWRSGVTGGPTSRALPTARDERALRELARSLRAKVWDPVAVHLDGVSVAFVVPDGAFNLVPLAALPLDAERYLVDTGPTIHYLSAERDIVLDPHPRLGKGALVVGGPGYGQLTAAPAMTKAAARRASCGTFESIGFLPLPAARQEAEDIARLWRTLADTDIELPQVLTGARASEAAFKQSGPGRRVLHLATHGFFLDDRCEEKRYGGRGVGRLNRNPATAPRRILPDNPLLLSGLALAGANRRFAAKPTEEDGILTAEEVSALDLDGVEWAVLSACNTGIGQIKVGEGVFGLRRAFQVAGARTTIMSLWDVEDRAARAWMTPLYEGRLRDKLSTAEAVRHASQVVLRERRAKGLNTHPFYWAGFVAAGDWR